MAHKLYRDVLVVDEAHNLIPTIRDRLAVHIWQHDYRYPSNMHTPEEMRKWLGGLHPTKLKHKKIQVLREAVQYQVPTHIARRTTAPFNGKGTRRGFPEERDCIELLPVDISEAPPMMWPREVKKIVLMSATIGEKDIEALGLMGKGGPQGRRRVLYIKCKSPISPEHRPIVPLDVVNVNHHSMETGAVEQLANEINQIAAFHPNEKGVVHATYELARRLRSEGNPRYMFHDKLSKKSVFDAFCSSPASAGAILVASGMYEGIDLAEDLGRFQIVAKIPWPSLGDPAIKHLSALDPEWYLWETLKTTIQACGRICRTPEDYGATYILDSSFRRLYRQGIQMLPQWFVEAIDKQWIDEVLQDEA
jgi:Rad3-related DNA helicase